MSLTAPKPFRPAGRLLYSVEEAAELLGIGRTFMFHLVATGEIDSFKIGKRRKIPRDAIDSYIERLRAEQADEPRPHSPALSHQASPKRSLQS